MIIITMEIGYIMEIYNDSPGELVLIRNWGDSINGDFPKHSTGHTLDLKSCDPNKWPDVDLPYYRNIESEGHEVGLIASSYDWFCPFCNHANNEPEQTESVTCASCNTKSNVQGYSHPVYKKERSK